MEKPVLVAYWFKHDLLRIQERLNKFRIQTTVLKSETDIHEWNKGNITVGLLHPASAGHGLNLQKGGSSLSVVWVNLVS